MTVGDLGATLSNASRLGSSAGLLLQALENRAALALLELEEAGQHLQRAVVLAAVAGACALLGGFSLSLVVAAVFWDTPQRVPALSILALAELLVACGAGWMLMARARAWRAFTSLREQLEKDRRCLREILRRPAE